MPQVVLPYAPPTPPAGVHRYVFSLFQQPDGAAIDVRSTSVSQHSIVRTCCTCHDYRFGSSPHKHG